MQRLKYNYFESIWSGKVDSKTIVDGAVNVHHLCCYVTKGEITNSYSLSKLKIVIL